MDVREAYPKDAVAGKKGVELLKALEEVSWQLSPLLFL